MLQPQEQRWQSLGEKSSLFECLGIGLLGCFGQGRLQWILFFYSLELFHLTFITFPGLVHPSHLPY